MIPTLVVSTAPAPAVRVTSFQVPEHRHGHTSPPESNPILLVRPNPSQPQAGEPVTLHLMIHARDGQRISNLDMAHEAKVHLIVVRDGLDTFDHLHPHTDAQGNLIVDHVFSLSGTYRLYADFVETGTGPAVATSILQVGGSVVPALPLTANVPGRVVVDGLDVNLATTNNKRQTRLDFAISTAGRPVTDIRPYLGAAGHLVLIGERNGRFVHVHPAEADLQRGRMTFDAHFPSPGLYKGWLQFRLPDRVHITPFVLRAGA